MTIALLPSEIARLILNYLKEENLSKTYSTFLDECKYLDECKGFFKQGRTLPKTIHGKTLSQYLVISADELGKTCSRTRVNWSRVREESLFHVFSGFR